MDTLDSTVGFNIAPETLSTCFDKEPFGFNHSLSNSELFKTANLQTFTEKYLACSNERCQYYYSATGAKTPGSVFTSVPFVPCKPHEAMQRLDTGSYGIVLKRP